MRRLVQEHEREVEMHKQTTAADAEAIQHLERSLEESHREEMRALVPLADERLEVERETEVRAGIAPNYSIGVESSALAVSRSRTRAPGFGARDEKSVPISNEVAPTRSASRPPRVGTVLMNTSCTSARNG